MMINYPNWSGLGADIPWRPLQ